MFKTYRPSAAAEASIIRSLLFNRGEPYKVDFALKSPAISVGWDRHCLMQSAIPSSGASYWARLKLGGRYVLSIEIDLQVTTMNLFSFLIGLQGEEFAASLHVMVTVSVRPPIQHGCPAGIV